MDYDGPDCNEMLLQAVQTSNVEQVVRWLQHPDLNVNYRIGGGDTILFESIRVAHESIFLSLLNAGFDVNAMNEKKETPLRRAIEYSENNFVHELIKRGADINTPTNFTPLTHAVCAGDLDLVSLLLYYGANVNPVHTKNLTLCAVQFGHDDIAKILLNYYDEFFDNTTRTTCVHSLLQSCIAHNSYELFKLILSKHEKEFELNESVLMQYLGFVGPVSNSEWMECLHLLIAIIKIPFIKPLVTCTCSYNNLVEGGDIFFYLFRSFYERQIELHDRIGLTYLFLSYGVKLTAEAVSLAYVHYGFNEELEAFLYTFSYNQSIIPPIFLPVPQLIFTLEDDHSALTFLYQKQYPISVAKVLSSINSRLVFEQLLSGLHDCTATGHLLENAILTSIGFCSLTGFQKQSIKELCRVHVKNIEPIIERLSAIPEFPSLFELSRNQTRKFIKQQYNISKPSQFYEIVKSLNVPVYIKDVICFKAAIY